MVCCARRSRPVGRCPIGVRATREKRAAISGFKLFVFYLLFVLERPQVPRPARSLRRSRAIFEARRSIGRALRASQVALQTHVAFAQRAGKTLAQAAFGLIASEELRPRSSRRAVVGTRRGDGLGDYIKKPVPLRADV